jgi:serine/threonine protein kinase
MGPGYQDRLASHRDDPTKRRRARIYLVPQEERIERRQQLRRAAEREWQLLWELRDHPNILRASDQIPDAPLGPVVLFDDVPGALRLDAFLRGEPTLSFDERFSIIEQVGLALSYCHKKGIVHSALSPESVLVRRGPAGTLEARLYDFQLADSETISGTHHWTELAAEPWRLYQAPELRRDPTARSPASDLYSLGALALFVLTGRPPAASLVELEKRLQDHQTLLSSDIDWGALPGWLRDLVGGATASTVAGRYDDVDGWLEVARSDYTADLESRTRPAGPAAVDAKLAVAGDIVAPDLTVVKVLGQGATARVVEVERRGDGRHFALKVPLGPDHHARIEAEALELEALDHPNVVRLEELRILSGRPCLLLGLAGSQTLFHLLQREGSLGLDLAIRYGEELLAAVRHLEQEGRLHRDIKPANLGVGSADRKALRLVLFDFSLAAAPLTDVSVGTAVYRDPFLYARGRWDAPADRWSVAVTLHEILTGTRPSFGGRPGGELDPAAPLVLAAERFDAAVRDRLVQFFHRALARDAEARFDSAESMRRAWTACFADPLFAPAGEAPRPPHAAVALTVPFEWAKLAPDAPLAALPLDLRAKNALDRAGLVQAGELLSLADNRLSAIRGIGRQTSRAILEARDAWKAARAQAALEPPTPPAFHPAYVGPDLLLTSLDLDPALASALEGAGLGTLSTLAFAPAAQVAAIARRHQVEPAALHTLLVREAAGEADAGRPATLDAWIDALFPKGSKKSPPWPRRLFGVEVTAPDGSLEPELDAATIAARFEVTTANVYIALSKWRKDLRASKAAGQLAEVVLPLLDEHRGVAALATLADALASRIPHASDVPRELVRVRTAALVRALAEAEKPAQDDDPPGALLLTRLHGRLYAVSTEAHAAALRSIATVADELADRPVVASSTEATRALAEAAEGTPLAAFPPDALLDLAASASTRASVSSRRELYPNGLPPERALDLASPLPAGTPEDIARRVAQRYPAAAPLPPRPALDALVRAAGLAWDDVRQSYVRPGEAAAMTGGTVFSALRRAPTTVPSHRALDEDAIAAQSFEEQLLYSMERSLFRVLAVPFHRSVDAAQALGHTLGLPALELDQRIAASMRALMTGKNVKPEAVVRADREGPGSGTFKNLEKLAHDAGDALLTELLAPRTPLLLVQPGLVARYRMDSFVRRLVEAGRRNETPAIFLLVPAVESHGVPAINGDTPLPGVLREDVLWVPRAYLENRHHSAA